MSGPCRTRGKSEDADCDDCGLRCLDGGLHSIFRGQGVIRTDDIGSKPYAGWLEGVVREMFDIDPVCVAMQMRDGDGKSYTCYWNCTQDDRAVMADAVQLDGLLDLIRNNRGTIAEILSEDDGEEGGEDE